MGITYKLKPEIIDLILEEKKKNSSISCRKLSKLIEAKFSVEISKSSINALIKDAGLSMPVGRRNKKTPQKITPAVPALPKPESEKKLLQDIPTPAIELPEVKEEIPAPPIELPEKKEETFVPPAEPIVPVAEEATQIPTEPKEEVPLAPEPEASVPPEAKEEVPEEVAPPSEIKEEAPLPPVEEGTKPPAEVKEETPLPSEEKVTPPEIKEEIVPPAEEKPTPVPEPTPPAIEEPAPPEAKEEEPLPPAEEIKPPAEENVSEEPVLPPEAKEEIPLPEEIVPPPEAKEEKPLPPAEEEIKPPIEEKVPEEPVLPAGPKEEAKPQPEVPPLEKKEPLVPVEEEIELPCAGMIFLKAVDYLAGGTHFLVEALKHKAPFEGKDTLDKLEYLLYAPLSQQFALKTGLFLNLFIGQNYTTEALDACIRELQLKGLNPDIGRIFARSFKEIRCIKLVLSDKSTLYIDGQFRTLWSTPYVPYGFSSTLHTIKRYISRYFLQDNPLVIFIAPDQGYPGEDFFNFISDLELGDQQVTDVSLFTDTVDEIEHTAVAKIGRKNFIFGSKPRQFGAHCQIRATSEFKAISLDYLEKTIYIAEATAQLSQPNLNKTIPLRVLVLRKNQEGGEYFLIFTNLSVEKANSEELLYLYLKNWPDCEDAFQDFNRKVDFFGYMAQNYQPMTIDDCIPQGKTIQDIRDIRGLFEVYLKALDLYVKKCFLPMGYEDRGLSEMAKFIYSLPGKVKKEKDRIIVKINSPQGHPFLQDLRYAVKRVNEAGVISKENKRVWVLLTP